MAGSFPTIRGGYQAIYPVTRTVSFDTGVMLALNATEQRWKKRAPLTKFSWTASNLKSADVTSIVNFHASQKGAYDPTWSFTLGSTTYSNLTFEDDVLQIKEDRPALFSIAIKARQTQNRNAGTPSVSAVYPTLASGFRAQLPYTQLRRFSTMKQDVGSGVRYSYSWWGGGLTGFPTGSLMGWELQYPALSDADLSTLETFFRGMNGRWNQFSFTDPQDSVAHTKCRFDVDEMVINHSNPGLSTTTLRIVEFN